MHVVALNVKRQRKQRKLSQMDLAERSGVTLGSLKRFERTGQISFESLLKLAVPLNALEPFENLFASMQDKYQNASLDELLKLKKS